MIGEENGWFKININGQTGFVSGEFVSKSGATNNNVSTGGNNKVTADVLRVRTALTHLVLFLDVYMKDKH